MKSVAVRIAVYVVVLAGGGWLTWYSYQVYEKSGHPLPPTPTGFNPTLGPDSPLVREEGERQYLWAAGDRESGEAEWFDVTGSPIAPERFEYGIGRDRIQSIDEPKFLRAGDPRLPKLGMTKYVKVIGVVIDGEARAYPTAILQWREVVNDTVAGKPVTVGW